MADTATSDLLTVPDNYYADTAEEIETDHSEADEAETGDQDDHGQDDESETDTDETGDEEGGESEGEFEIQLDGRSEKITKAELIKGYQRQADYTRKTTAIAEDRKALTAERAKVDEALSQLKAVQGDIEKLIMGDVSGINWDELRTNDPSEYLRMKEVVQSKQGELKRITEQAQKLEQERLPAKQLALTKAMGWDHPEKGAQRREADIKLIQEYHASSPLLATTDPDVVIALIESARYRNLQKTKAAVKPELKKAPKVSKTAKTSKTQGFDINSWYK